MLRNIIVFAVICLLPIAVFGQTNTKAGKGKDKKAKAPPTQLTTADKEQLVLDLESKIADLHLAQRGLGDYVPCVFTKEELLNLRLAPSVPRLTARMEEDLKSAVLSMALAKKNQGLFDPQSQKNFAEALSNASLLDLTPSQALAKVITLLRQNVSLESKLLTAAMEQGMVPLRNVAESFLIAQKWVNPNTDLGKVLEQKMTDIAATFHQESSQDKLNFVANQADNLATNVLTMKEGTTNEKQAAAQGFKALSEAASDAEVNNKQSDSEAAIVQSARKSIEHFERPPDVGCAMSLLSWNETRYAFGNLIANEYIAVQIVVRNLNSSQDFLLHDAQVAVDSDPNGLYGRFFSGRDKIIVRAIANAQQHYTPRNVLIHSLETIGGIMSAVVPVWEDVQGLGAASGAFNSGFLPGLRKTWPDLSVDQMNLISDIGFSSSTTYKTVVPKSAAAVFVVFVPAKQFQEGWWTQDCAHRSFIDKQPSDSTSPVQQVGVDVNKALKYCAEHLPQNDCSNSDDTSACVQVVSQATSTTTIYKAEDGSLVSKATTTTTTDNQGHTTTQNTSTGDGRNSQSVQTVSFRPKSVKYHDWSPTALALFRELVFAVVAGSHIQEQNQNVPTVNELVCPHTTEGALNLNDNDGDKFNCTVTGQNLDKAQALRLRNKQNATDSVFADGTVTVHGDSNSANLSFDLKDLGALNAPNYDLYAVTKDGVETNTGRVIHLDLQPLLTDIKGPVDLTTDSKTTLSGFHLEKLGSVILECPNCSAPLATLYTVPANNPQSTSAPIDLADAKTTPAFVAAQFPKDGLPLNVSLQPSDPTAGKIQTKRTLTVKGSK